MTGIQTYFVSLQCLQNLLAHSSYLRQSSIHKQQICGLLTHRKPNAYFNYLLCSNYKSVFTMLPNCILLTRRNVKLSTTIPRRPVAFIHTSPLTNPNIMQQKSYFPNQLSTRPQSQSRASQSNERPKAFSWMPFFATLAGATLISVVVVVVVIKTRPSTP